MGDKLNHRIPTELTCARVDAGLLAFFPREGYGYYRNQWNVVDLFYLW